MKLFAKLDRGLLGKIYWLFPILRVVKTPTTFHVSLLGFECWFINGSYPQNYVYIAKNWGKPTFFSNNEIKLHYISIWFHIYKYEFRIGYDHIFWCNLSLDYGIFVETQEEKKQKLQILQTMPR